MLATANAHRISGQSSRASINEEEDEEYDLTHPFPSLSIISSSSLSSCTMIPPIIRKLDEISALFVHNNIAYGIMDCFLQRGFITPLTSIQVNNHSIYEVYVSVSYQNSLLFKMNHKLLLSDQDVNDAMKFLLESISFKEIMILDSIIAAKFIPNNGLDVGNSQNIFNENLRVVRTKNFDHSDWLKKVCVGDQHKASLLESGNVITGNTASILCACDVRNIPALALLCVREAAFDTREARRFEEYWEVYCSKFLPMDNGHDMNVPSVEVYNNLRRSDPFMLSTETLYT